MQWLPPRLAYRYAQTRPGRIRGELRGFIADGTGWRNATIADCLPSTGWAGVVDVTEEAGYGLRYFRDTYFRDSARSRMRRGSLRLIGTPPLASRPPAFRRRGPCRT